MKWLPTCVLLASAAALAQASEQSGAIAHMHDASGQPVGTVHFSVQDGKTVVKANIHGLEPGYHGFHIHEMAECDPDAQNGPFTSAGGHYNGHSGHAGHSGDMPSLHVNQDGTARMTVALDRFTPQDLLDDKTTVIIHAGPDNFGNIPERYQSNRQEQPGPDAETLGTGDAGPRQACGVVTAFAS